MIGVLVSGNGSNLQALLDAGLPIRAVAANRKDAYALIRAREAGVPAATFGLDCHAGREERDLMMATWLEEHGVELVVLAGYMHLLTKPFLDRFPGRIVNVHPSLLPEFPGSHARRRRTRGRRARDRRHRAPRRRRRRHRAGAPPGGAAGRAARHARSSASTPSSTACCPRW